MQGKLDQLALRGRLDQLGLEVGQLAQPGLHRASLDQLALKDRLEPLARLARRAYPARQDLPARAAVVQAMW